MQMLEAANIKKKQEKRNTFLKQKRKKGEIGKMKKKNMRNERKGKEASKG